MTRAAKQWTTTGFIIGVGAGIAIVIAVLMLRGGTPEAFAAPSSPTSATVAAPSGRSLLAGTISLDPAVASKVNGPSIVFVIARSGNGKGHPILAKRLDIASFPAKFALTTDDTMMGAGDPPKQVTLEVRIDRDGDAMTREPGVPAAVLQNVVIGSGNVVVTLR